MSEEQLWLRAAGKCLACLLAHSSCVYDGVEVYSLASAEAVLAPLCGSSVPGPVLTFGPMLLHFYSDSLITDAGFLAEYRAIRKFPPGAARSLSSLDVSPVCPDVSESSSNESSLQPSESFLCTCCCFSSAEVWTRT